jgi:excisionase family DNA binding protein
MAARTFNQPAEIRPEELGATRLLSIIRVAEALGISRSKAYDLMADGQLKFVKIGRRRLVPREAIDEFVRSLIST